MTSEQQDSGPLSGTRTVVLGGTGSVGEHMVRAHLAAGAEVVVPSRTEEKAATLRGNRAFAELPGQPIAHVSDYTSFPGAQQAAEAITSAHGPVDHVVATLGSWWSGAPAWSVDEEVWRRYLVDVTEAYFASARAWLPRLGRAGSLQLVLGASGVVPVPGASVISMAQASLVMMRRVIAEEAGPNRRVFSIVLGNLNVRRRGWSRPDFVDADDAGHLSVRLARGSAPSAEFIMRTPVQAAAALSGVEA